jgi:DNA-directed RNA polymerase specialized sigma24 family protein
MEPGDKELLSRVQKRDAEAIEEFVRKRQGKIAAMLYVRFGLGFVAADLDDILAHIKWVLYDRPHPKDGFTPDNVGPWLRTVALRKAVDLHDQRSNECSLETDGAHQKADQNFSAREVERAVDIRELIDSYPKREQALASGFLLGKTIEELVSETGQSKSVIGRWRAKFKKRFKGDAGDTPKNRDIAPEGGNI